MNKTKREIEDVPISQLMLIAKKLKEAEKDAVNFEDNGQIRKEKKDDDLDILLQVKSEIRKPTDTGDDLENKLRRYVTADVKHVDNRQPQPPKRYKFTVVDMTGYLF